MRAAELKLNSSPNGFVVPRVPTERVSTWMEQRRIRHELRGFVEAGLAGKKAAIDNIDPAQNKVTEQIYIQAGRLLVAATNASQIIDLSRTPSELGDSSGRYRIHTAHLPTANAEVADVWAEVGKAFVGQNDGALSVNRLGVRYPQSSQEGPVWLTADLYTGAKEQEIVLAQFSRPDPETESVDLIGVELNAQHVTISHEGAYHIPHASTAAFDQLDRLSTAMHIGLSYFPSKQR